jgi:hypothetical protein
MLSDSEFERRAPYAPVSALREFFERIRDMSAPPRVDRRFLQRLNVASNNEWALLSALKFLGVIDERGAPTHAYRLLQTTDRFQETLRHLVETAYEPLFDLGGAAMSLEDLRNYFRVSSSPSQAKNAARFFREVCEMAGVRGSATRSTLAQEIVEDAEEIRMPPEEIPPRPAVPGPARDLLLEAKARLLEKLPTPRPDWSAAEYEAICRHFLAMLQHLDNTG